MAARGRPRKGATATTYTANRGSNEIKLDFGTLNPKQAEFWKSRARFACLVFTLTAPLYIWTILGL